MRVIKLTKGAEAIVCDCHYDTVASVKWHLHNEGYAARAVWRPDTRKNISILMHRIIADTPAGLDTDHINRNRLDNRCENLRVCTRKENLLNKGMDTKNTSGYTGVGWDKSRNKWMAYFNRRDVGFQNLGRFDTKDEAIQARTAYVTSIS